MPSVEAQLRGEYQKLRYFARLSLPKPLFPALTGRSKAASDALRECDRLLDHMHNQWQEEWYVAARQGDHEMLRGLAIYIASSGSIILEHRGSFARAGSVLFKTHAANLHQPGDNFVPSHSGLGMTESQALGSMLQQMTRAKPWVQWIGEKADPRNQSPLRTHAHGKADAMLAESKKERTQ